MTVSICSGASSGITLKYNNATIIVINVKIN